MEGIPTMTKTLCLYHKNCTDGLGAAWAIREFWKRTRRSVPVFQSIQYGTEPPNVSDYNEVIIVDFSFPRETLLQMKEQVESLLVIDHHKSAEAEIADLDFCIFDNEKSGCVLTWEYFFLGQPMPKLFAYLQDRDLWRWELPLSQEVNAALRSYKPFFNVWDNFMTDNGVEHLKDEGVAILRYQNQQIETVLSQEIELIEIDGWKVPCVNCTHLISEIGNKLAQEHPFAALYFDTTDGKRVFSLRSTDEGEDVAVIAKKYGGGGHRNAAGFTIERPMVI
jgi:oligoribonuclease NrnB/cAMP/cGMP phosphodiesterase (DHH superfamily)